LDEKEYERLKREQKDFKHYKIFVGREIPEFGKRLMHVKEDDDRYWKLNTGHLNEKRIADNYIRVYEQFGDAVPSDSKITLSKFLEMLSLPHNIDRIEFITKNLKIPSTGEKKKVEEMTLMELKETTKQIKEVKEMEEIASRRREEAEKIWLESNRDKVELTKEQVKYLKKKKEKTIEELKKVEPQVNNDPKKISPKALINALMAIRPSMEMVERDELLLETYKDEVDKIEGKIINKYY
jgi:hypothetical protein